jgi:hypothetical protein
LECIAEFPIDAALRRRLRPLLVLIMPVRVCGQIDTVNAVYECAV